MFQELPELPGLKSSALLGDLLLLSGQQGRAALVYLEAWRGGDLAALEAFLALEGAQAPLELLLELSRELALACTSGVIARRRAEPAARVLVGHLLLVRGLGEAASVALVELLGAMPQAQLCLGTPRAPAALWQRALAQAREGQQGQEQDSTGYLSLRLAWMEAVARLSPEPLRRPELRRRGPWLYLALRALDRVPPLWRPEAEARGDQLRQALLFLTQEVQDRRERAVWGCRLGDRLWAEGGAQEARAVYEALGSAGPTPLEALSRDRLQRLHVALEQWPEAAAQAQERAGICDDGVLREAFWLLALDYLHRAPEGAAGRLEAARRLLELDERGQPISKATRRLAFEIYEGELLDQGAHEDLVDFWRRQGALPEQETVLVDRRARGQDRAVECYLLAGDSHLPAQSIAEDPVLRRLAVVRALSRDHPRAALHLLRAALVLRDEERLLRAVLWVHLGRRGELSAGDEARVESARQELEGLAGMSALGAEHDLLSLYVLRSLLRERGELDKERVVFTQVWAAWPPGVQASLQALLGRDMLEGGRAAEALALARRAFALAPGEARVRALLRDAAQATGDEGALGLLEDMVDDGDLSALFAEEPQAQGQLQEALGLQERDPSRAVALLVSLAEGRARGASRAALLRRAGEMVRDRVGDQERALALLLRSVEAHGGDRLASRGALELLLRLGRLEEAANLLEATDWRDPLVPDLASLLLQEGLRRARRREVALARVLLRRGALAMPQGVQLEEVRQGLLCLLELESQAHQAAPVASLLELLLAREAEPEQRAWLHLRMGQLKATHLEAPQEAIEHWRSALLGPQSRGEALTAMEEHFASAGRFQELVSLLREESARAAAAMDEDAPRRRAAYLEALAHVLAEHMEDPQQARLVLEEVLRLQPRNLGALLQAATLDLAMERHEEGVAGLEAAARLVEDQTERSALYAEIGGVYEGLGSQSMALQAYMVSFICDNRNLQTFERLEHLYGALGRWRDLLSIYEVATDVARQEDDRERLEELYARRAHVEFHHLEQEEAAARSFLEALRLHPQQDRYAELILAILSRGRAPEILVEVHGLRAQVAAPGSRRWQEALGAQAQVLLQLGGRQREALEIYQRLVEASPEDTQAAERLEALYKETESWEELVAFYQARLARAQGDEAALPLAQAVAQIAERKLRDFSLATSTYEALLESSPENLWVIRSLGRLYEATREWDALIRVTRREVELVQSQEQRAHLHFKLGSIYETARHEPLEAIACYQAALVEDPGCVPALHGLRELYRGAGQWERVMETLQREAELWDKPRERAGVLAMMGQIQLEELGDPAAAEGLLRQALALEQTMQRPARLLLDLYMEQRRWSEAAPLADQLWAASQKQPGPTRAALALRRAQIARLQGEAPVSRLWLRQAVELGAPPRELLAELLALLEAGHAPGAEEAAALEVLRQRSQQGQDRPARAWLALYEGALLERGWRLEEALASYREAVSLAPAQVEPSQRLAALHRKLRQFEEESQVWSQLVTASQGPQGDPQVELRARRALAQLYRDWTPDLARCMGHLRRAQALAPQDLSLRFEEAQALFLQRRFEEARELMQGLLEEAGEHPMRSAWRFYLGRVHELGLQQVDAALACYEQARQSAQSGQQELEAVLASVQLLLRLERQEQLATYLTHTLEEAQSREVASHGELQLLRAHILVGSVEGISSQDASGSEDLEISVDGPRLEFSDITLTRSQDGEQPEALLWRQFQEDPSDARVLRGLAQVAQRRGWEHAQRRLFVLMTALGVAQPHERKAAEGFSGPLGVVALENAAYPELLRGSDVAGLAFLQALLARSFPSGAAVLQPDDLERAVHIEALRMSVAAALREPERQQEVVPRSMGPEGTSLRFTNQRLQGHGALPLALVSVSLDFESLMQGGESLDAAARFLLAKALEHVRLGLASCRAMSLGDVGHCLEVLWRCRQGASLDDVQDVAHLRPVARKLRAYGLPRMLPSLLQVMDARGPGEAIEDPASGRRRAEALLDALESCTDRVGLVVCGDIGAALDALGALETGQALRSLPGQGRVEILRRQPRARELVAFYLSGFYAAARGES